MDQQEWKKVNNIVDTALELQGEKRNTFIEKKCGEDEVLKSKVTRLIESIEQSDTEGFLESTQDFPSHLAADFSKGKQESASSLIGETIDQYTITKLIGHGGMGSVFLAERADGAYDRPIALKVMRRGMDTPSNITRFERERNILANLDHTNIARLLDGGVTGSGLPYLVMEYVEGVPLVEYCNTKRLSIQKRVSLFRQVCKAVKHAHTNATIHRDLKPSNILVTENEKVKVLDFGIAKLLDPDDPESTLLQTRTGARMLTLGYAAPEQLESKTVTTATDSYTLGILLYELLCGMHPFEMDNKDLTEIEKIIRNEEAVSPSEKFINLSAAKQKKLARKRNATAPAIIKQLRGDLDAIVIKALRKEPEARYSSAEQLLEDLKRRAQNLPILARKDTFRYNLSKFLRRHKTGISVAAGFILLIIGFAGFYTLQITEERNKAQQEAQKAEATTSFLTDLIESNHPSNAQGDTISVREFLDQGFSKVRELDENPIIKAEIMQVMGHTYRGLGENEKARDLITESLSLIENNSIPTEEQAPTYNTAGLIYRDLGKSKKAIHHFQQSIALFEKAGKTNNKEYAKVLRDLAYMKAELQEFAEAEEHIKKAIEIGKVVSGTNSPQLSESYYVLASILRRQSKYAEAFKFQSKSYGILKDNIDGPHPGKMANLNNLGIIYSNTDSTEKAINAYKNSIAMGRKLYGKDLGNQSHTFHSIAMLFKDKNMLDSALAYSDSSMLIAQKTLTPNHQRMSYILLARANILGKMNSLQKADSLYEKAFEVAKIHYNISDRRQLVILNQWGRVARLMGDHEKSLALLNKAYNNYHETAKFDKDLRRDIINNLASTHKELQHTSQADSLLELLSSTSNE